MSDAPERTPLSCDEHDWYSAPHGNQRLDRCPWCEVERLRAAIEKWANAVGERERFDAESELIALTKTEGE